MLTKKHIARLFKRFGAGGLTVTHAMQAELDRDYDGVVEIWLEDLAGLTAEDVVGALAAFYRSGPKFWPSAPQLRALVPRLALAAQDQSEAAFGIFWGMFGSPGSAQLLKMQADGVPWVEDPEMDRRMKAAAIAMGGVRAVGQLPIDNLVAHRASFRRGYQAAAEKERTSNRELSAAETGCRKVLPFRGPVKAIQ